MLTTAANVLRYSDLPPAPLHGLLAGYQLGIAPIPDAAPIPASFWGEPEAGLRGNLLYLRVDTPLHSILHEGGHFICMDPQRRSRLDQDAGGDDLEESAVCYLQILLADELPGLGAARLCADMDTWGYSFRLGSSARWFHEDATDARDWLRDHGIIDAANRPTGNLRTRI